MTNKQKDKEKSWNCVQCGEYLEHSYGNDMWSAPFCGNPKCPNYCLLQTGVLPVNKPNEK